MASKNSFNKYLVSWLPHGQSTDQQGTTLCLHELSEREKNSPGQILQEGHSQGAMGTQRKEAHTTFNFFINIMGHDPLLPRGAAVRTHAGHLKER